MANMLQNRPRRVSTVGERSTLVLNDLVQATTAQIDVARELRFGKARCSRLCERTLHCTKALLPKLDPTKGPPALEWLDGLELLQATAQGGQNLVRFYRTATIFELYLRRSDCTDRFRYLNENLIQARKKAGLPPLPSWTSMDSKDLDNDVRGLALELAKISGSHATMESEILSIPNLADRKKLLNEFMAERARDPSRTRGLGYEALFIKNSISQMCRLLEVPTPAVSLPATPASATMPAINHVSPPLQPFALRPPSPGRRQRPVSLAAYTDAVLGNRPPSWISPTASASTLPLSEDTIESSLATQPLFIPINDIGLDPLLRPPSRQRRQSNPRPPSLDAAIPQLFGAGSGTVLKYLPKQLTWAPFTRWLLWNEPANVPGLPTLGLKPGDVTVVTQTWSALSDPLSMAIADRRIPPSALQYLHPPPGTAMRMLGFFQIDRELWMAGLIGDNVGLVPVAALAPGPPKNIIICPIHEGAKGFQALTVSGTTRHKVNGIVHALAIEWRIVEGPEAKSPWISHRLEDMRGAYKSYEALEDIGRRPVVTYWVLIFRCRTAQGQIPVQLVFGDETAVDEVIDALRSAFPTMDIRA